MLQVEFCVVFSFAGSKEEIFFDSQPWLESDCEDDFYSVNGGKNTKCFEPFLSCMRGSWEESSIPLYIVMVFGFYMVVYLTV